MRWLLDEMLPPLAAERLGDKGHDAVSVHHIGLAGASDDEVFAAAVEAGRIIVTENFADYAAILNRRLNRGEACVPVVFVRKSTLPRGGALARALADHLGGWADAHPDPYLGLHWPSRFREA